MTTVAPSGSIWLKSSANNQKILFSNEPSSKLIPLNTNLDVSITSKPVWCTVSKEDKGVLLVQVKANSDLYKRTGIILLQAKDDKKLSLTISQLGEINNFETDKDNITLYSDQLSFDLSYLCNTEYKIEMPEWLSIQDSTATMLQFVAQELRTASYRDGKIYFRDNNDKLMHTIFIKQMSDESSWFTKPCFAVISDIHYGDKYCDGYDVRMPRVFSTLNSHTPSIRNIFVVGDLANNGSEWQYIKIATQFNRPAFLDTSITTTFMLGNHDHFTEEGPIYFQEHIKQPLNQYQDIQGYPFISLSCSTSSYNGSTCYDKETMQFLSNSLADANAHYPGKPIFVFQHILPLNTIVGSHTYDDNAYALGLDELFSRYPQVIDFTGHTHFTIIDPLQIYQKNYTVMNDGGERHNRYARYHNDYTRDFPQQENVGAEKYEAITEGLIVHIDSAGAVIVERWNTALNEKYSPDWVIAPPFDGSNFQYTTFSGGKAPWWKSGSEIILSDTTDTSCKITFPQAADDEGVYHYVINITTSNGTKVTDEINQSSLLTRGKKQPGKIAMAYYDLPSDTQLTCTVIAYDAYDQPSPPLSKTFTLNKDWP